MGGTFCHTLRNHLTSTVSSLDLLCPDPGESEVGGTITLDLSELMPAWGLQAKSHVRRTPDVPQIPQKLASSLPLSSPASCPDGLFIQTINPLCRGAGIPQNGQ